MIIAVQTLVFFRESLLSALNRILQPYYKRFSLAFSRNDDVAEDDDGEDQVFADFDEEKGVVFFPPVYVQRYAAVADCLMDERWRGQIEKVVDFGYHDMSFIKYLKEVPGIQYILGVDLESMPLRCSSDLFACDDYTPKRESPLQVTLFQGNAADPDYRLIGCDAVIGIEMIEHMLPHDLERLVHTVFGFIKPRIVVFTTPNADFNVLFKALEKNGLRRWDHFFEWTREQFHDWCSNIVVRYPLYTVTCQGVGPGPASTLHLGSCSQLALFINKDYHKQADLDLNSLALVQKAPSVKPLHDLVEWDSPDNSITDGEADAPAHIESVTELMYTDYTKSGGPLMVSPSLSVSMPYFSLYPEVEESFKTDKAFQCNLDTEYGKSFLMFDRDDLFDVMVPRRTVNNRVYEIEDVASRLNCSTLQVKKFSKTTQNLMAKNKVDSLVHTRQVVDEIRHLTKILNFNKSNVNRPDSENNVWCNINWGDNAPYWNQYYKIVKEYNYLIEVKSDECRILELISDEINRMIDMQFDEASCDVNRLEIPISHLMTVVDHITDNADRVRDLLEWNGYQVVDDLVIYSRLMVDYASFATHDDEWQENDTNYSDWDNVTEVRSTTVSDGSTIAQDYQDRCLRRALDHKLHNLRTMLTADEDITTELDKVVCKLMKLALRTSKGRSSPPPTKWMQCKLLDLLTLTEKSIERRKKHIIENSLRPSELGFIEDKMQNIVSPNKSLEDDIAKDMADNYCHIMPSPDASTKTAVNEPICRYNEEDLMSTTSNEFLKDMEYVDVCYSSPVVPPKICVTADLMERTKAWLNVDVEINPYNKDMHYDNISTEDTDSMANVRHKQKRSKHMTLSNNEIEPVICTTPPSKASLKKYKSKREDKKKKTSNTRIGKKVARKKSGHYNVKNTSSKYAVDYQRRIARPKRRNKENRCLTMRASKPIPESIIDLCHPELKVVKCSEDFLALSNVQNTNNIVMPVQSSPTEAMEENMLVDIIMDDTMDSIGIHRSIGTDAEIEDSIDKNQVENLSNDIDINLFTRHEVSTENIYSQTIFLNDINEPSTSKGIRHNIGMDVQCGPDTLPAYPMLSAFTSLTQNPSGFSTGIRIFDEVTEYQVHGVDFGTTTQDNGNDTIITPRSRSIGIKIKDSGVNIAATLENFTMSQESAKLQNVCNSVPPSSEDGLMTLNSSLKTNVVTPENEIKTKATDLFLETGPKSPITSALKTVELGYQLRVSTASPNATTPLTTLSKSTSEMLLIKSSECKESREFEKYSSIKCNKPTLCCGGIHVHSYKDRQVSEDIIYQGEWQKYRAKSNRKKSHNTILAKKINESCCRKQKETAKEKRMNPKDKTLVGKPDTTEGKILPRKPVQVRKERLLKIKPEAIKNQPNTLNSSLPKPINAIPNVIRPPKSLTNVSKVASKITMNSKHVKSAFTTKKPQIVTPLAVKQESNTYKMKKSHIPLYMKKRNIEKNTDKNNLNKSFESANTDAEKKKEALKKKYPSLVRSKTDEIRKDLINFHGNLTRNTYLVFRNEERACNSTTGDQNGANTTSDKINTNENADYITGDNSSQSLNSSTCSSPSSIATVRTNTKSRNLAHRRHSASSHKSSVNTSESDNTTPNKNKKVPLKCRSIKKSNKDTNNKENIPLTTENFANKETDKTVKSPFVHQRKSVCIAQLKTDRSTAQQTTTRTSLKRKASNKSNVKIPTPENTVEKKRSLNMDVLIKSLKSETFSENADILSNQSTSFGSPECANMVLVVKPQDLLPRQQNIVPTESVVNTVENSLLTEWMQNSHIDSEANIANYMRHLIEDLLDVIDFVGIIDSRFMTLSLDGTHSRLAMNESMCSFKTVTADYLNNTYPNSLNRTFDSVLGDESIVSLTGTRLTVTDLDLLSFKSITSVSKHSEYFLADSELNSSTPVVEPTESPRIVLSPTSVTDIFERREPRSKQNPASVIANQAFSGFTLDGEPVTGDQPDPISLIDSETGSLAMAIARQATSEELFVSGRSSESYQSCLLDEDAVVPNWLFQMISQQHSVAENQPFIGPQPLAEPMYDGNGNVVETNMLGVAAGAGDGRGIHSDQSQDSSGRGTSLSTSNNSFSSTQSEAILVEPSGFTGQFELQPDPTASSARGHVDVASSRDERLQNMEDNDAVTLTVHNRRRPRLHLNAVSDIDADISSLDTDVIDSSDN